MNNFFLNQPDPLLQNGMYENIPNPILLQQIQPQQFKDNVKELDDALKSLSPSMVERLSQDSKFSMLSADFQTIVQQELLLLVRNKLNMNPKIQNNIQEQLSIIEETKRNIEKEKESSINEMNDYMNNYAHLTFDEYRRMKNGEPLDKKKR
jgi:methyltransferase-like protein